MGKQTRQSRNEYIHNFARTAAGHVGVKAGRFDCADAAAVAIELKNRGFMVRVYAHLIDRDDELIGRLACCGVNGQTATNFSRVAVADVSSNNGDWLAFLAEHDTRVLVMQLATSFD